MKFRFFAILTGALLASGCAVQEYSGDREAARWMGYAAEEGNAYAQYNYGMCCLYGEGVPKDRKMAVHYLRLAAAGGYQEAVEALEELEKTSVK